MPRSYWLIAITVGSTLGSYVPTLWGGDLFSITSVLCGGAGGLLALWMANRIAH
ncbi:MAG: hypothetical protein HY294_17890 [Candidatus Rokubacteria bacterium]|nr:hypothetical protein [Candidatus Rokubacteria bacterium]